jgi:Kdo2-lipid IVA lauroyltransferase/acyltransferase
MRKPMQKLTHWAIALSLDAIFAFSGILTWKAAARIGIWMGEWAFFLSGKYRQQTVNNISIAFPGMPMDEKYRLAQAVFGNLGRCVLETVMASRLKPEQICDLVDADRAKTMLAATLEKNRSAMILTGHYGNWELFAARMAQIAPLTVLARTNNNPGIQRRITESRAELNITVVDRDDPSAGRKMRAMSIKGGEILGILMDQDTRVKGIFSKFLGVSANTPSGPASIAVKDWFDVYTGFIVYNDTGSYRIELTGPLEIVRTGNGKSDIQANTDMFNDLIGRRILADPAQWVWMHRRWRRRPQEDAGSDAGMA